MLARAPPLVEKFRVALREIGDKEVVIFFGDIITKVLYVLKCETGNAVTWKVDVYCHLSIYL